ICVKERRGVKQKMDRQQGTEKRPSSSTGLTRLTHTRETNSLSSKNACDSLCPYSPLPTSHYPSFPFLSLSPNPNSRFSFFPSFPKTLTQNPSRTLSSLCSAQSECATENTGGRSGALSPPPIAEAVERIDVNPPKGTRDFPPEEMRLRSWLFQNFKEVSQQFGFEEVDFPVLESEALFIRKAGEEIRDQLFCFEDQGSHRVALRLELTPSLARLVIQKGYSVSLPLKWFAVGQC
ncbi:Class II Histidinyl-tRNA synthetase (HisRS)-like catalytic core domain, partial [Dillenia turbinata]